METEENKQCKCCLKEFPERKLYDSVCLDCLKKAIDEENEIDEEEI